MLIAGPPGPPAHPHELGHRSGCISTWKRDLFAPVRVQQNQGRRCLENEPAGPTPHFWTMPSGDLRHASPMTGTARLVRPEAGLRPRSFRVPVGPLEPWSVRRFADYAVAARLSAARAGMVQGGRKAGARERRREGIRAVGGAPSSRQVSAGDCFENDAMSAEKSADGDHSDCGRSAGARPGAQAIRAEKRFTWAGRSALPAPKRR
jgi:hypothetical protein